MTLIITVLSYYRGYAECSYTEYRLWCLSFELSVVMLSAVYSDYYAFHCYAEFCYTECHYAEYRHPECYGAM
jgi:hypothetical protein